MQDFLKKYRFELIVAALALVTHLACFWLFVHAQNGDITVAVRDGDGFYDLAVNVAAGNGFSWSTEAPYLPNTMRTPGQPWIIASLLSVFGITGAAITQLLLATAIPLLGMKIAELITNSRKVALVTGVIMALDPTLARTSFEFYTETFFLLFFLSWLLLILHYFRRPSTSLMIFSSLLFGYTILIKPSVQYIPLFLIPIIFWTQGQAKWRQSLLHSVLFLVIVGAILSPWLIRNLNTFDTLGLSTQSTFVLYTNFAPAVLSVAEGRNFLELRDEFLTPEEYKGDAITFLNQDSYKERAIEIITAHPTVTLFIMTKSMVTFFTHDGLRGIIVGAGQSPSDFTPLIVVLRLAWIALTGMAFVGAAIYFITKPSPLTIFVITLVAYFALISTVAAFGTNPRYRLPVDPIIIAMAVVGAKFMFTYLTGKLRH